MDLENRKVEIEEELDEYCKNYTTENVCKNKSNEDCFACQVEFYHNKLIEARQRIDRLQEELDNAEDNYYYGIR